MSNHIDTSFSRASRVVSLLVSDIRLLVSLVLAIGACAPGSAWPDPDESPAGILRASLLRQLESGAPTDQLMEAALERHEVLRIQLEEGEQIEYGAFFSAEERGRFPMAVQDVIERHEPMDGILGELMDGEAEEAVQYGVDGEFGLRNVVGLSAQELDSMTGNVEGMGWVTHDIAYPEDLYRVTQAPPPAGGELSVLAIRGYVPGNEDAAMNEASIRNALVDSQISTQAFFSRAARSQFTFDVTVIGPLPIADETPEDCSRTSYFSWARRLEAEALELGVDTLEFDYVYYFLPEEDTSLCDWAGRAFSPGRTGWMRNTAPGTMSHELGHNFGMGHAGSASCPDHQLPTRPSRLETECDVNPVDDIDDLMGYLLYHLPNAPHQTAMGWLKPEEVVDVVEPGVYRINELHGNEDGVRVLRIPWLEDEVFVSLRGNEPGFGSPAYQGGALIHAATEVHTPSNTGDTVRISTPDRMLQDGGHLYDPHSGLAIEQLSHDETSVTVSVGFIKQRSETIDAEPETIEDVVVGVRPNGDEAILTLYHQLTGLEPEGGHPSHFDQFGARHSEIVAQLSHTTTTRSGVSSRGVQSTPLGVGGPPTPFVIRTEQASAAAYDPERDSFAVVVARRTDSGVADAPDIGCALRVLEIDAETGSLISHGELETECLPYAHRGITLDLLWTPEGFIVIQGEGGNILNRRGSPLRLGRFDFADAPFETVSALDFREIPATTQAKWPQLTLGTDTVLISWTQAYTPQNLNRVVALGYMYRTDRLVAPGRAAVAFESSESLEPLVLSAPLEDGEQTAWKGTTEYDSATDRFQTVFTGSAWEVMTRSFRMVAMQPADMSPLQVVSTHENSWEFGGSIARTNSGFVVVHGEDNRDFFDGWSALRVRVFDADMNESSQALFVPLEEALGGQVAAAPGSDISYVVNADGRGIHVRALGGFGANFTLPQIPEVSR